MTFYGLPRTSTKSAGRRLLFMPPLDEDLIERFVRFPGTLTPSARAAAEELLRSDAAARELAAFFRTFYEELDELDREGETEERPPNDSPSDERPPPCRGEA
jgi:hypothetical protein